MLRQKYISNLYTHLNSNYFILRPMNNHNIHYSNQCFSDWVSKYLLPKTRIQIQPSLIGVRAFITYQRGEIFSIETIDPKYLNINQLRNSLPKSVPIGNKLLIMGVFVKINNKNTSFIIDDINFKCLNGYIFYAYEIINSNLNYFTQSLFLSQLGFTIPKSYTTNIPHIELSYYRYQLVNKLIYTNVRQDGLLFTVNSKKLQKQLGSNSDCLNWRYHLFI